MSIPNTGIIGGRGNPGKISGLVAWLDASEPSLMTVAGGLVSAWLNKKDGSALGTAAGAERPTLTASAQNGRSGLTFDGTATLIHANSLSSTFSGTDKAFSVFGVFKRSSLAATNAYLSAANSGNATPICEFACNNTPKYRVSKTDDAAASVPVSELGTSDTNTHQITVISPGTTIDTWVDGSSLGSGVAFDVGATTLNTCSVGARVSTTTVVFFAGLIFEILIYSTNLAAANRLAIEAYLKSKWGL